MENFDADLYNLLFSNSSNSHNTAVSPMNNTVQNSNASNMANRQNAIPMNNMVQNTTVPNTSNTQNTAVSPMNNTVQNPNVPNMAGRQNMAAPMNNMSQNTNIPNMANNMMAPATNNMMATTNVSNGADNIAADNKMKYVVDKASQLRQPKTAFPADTPVAMAYVPYQMWEKTYDCNIGFVRGTLFPSLDKPFIGEEAVPNERKR